MVAVLKTRSEEETREIGRCLGKWVGRGDVLALYGELGAGKTVLVKGLSQALGVEENVRSPSFTIIGEYEGRLPLYHIDLFRMSDVEEILKIGYEEYLYGDGVCAIEWAEKIENLLPDRRLDIRFYHVDTNERKIEVASHNMESPPLPAHLLADSGGQE
ncbi:MAG: tRNA (adenosine(37)-N6)-threonylcarbamoyltransferase complex ATPase subunit type 1 TsaE [bacterium]